MWCSTADRPTGKKRSASAAGLEQLIDARRQQLIDARLEVPLLRVEAQNLRAAAATMDARFQVRMKKDILQQADEIDRECQIRLSMRRESDFNAVSHRYLSHHAVGVTEADDDGARAHTDGSANDRIISVPGAHVQQTVKGFVNRSRARETQKHAIVQEYLADVEMRPNKLNIRARDECPFCNEPLYLNSVKSILVCTTCGYSVVHFDSTISTMSYADEYEFNSFSYKRISHFEDCMRQVQGKESFVVPMENITKVMERLMSKRLALHDITPTTIRETLKELRLRRAYDHVAQVFMRITGKKPSRVSAEVENTCRQMFVRMQPVFEKHCPKTRKNFLSYNYVLFRIFYILELEYMLGHFALLKCPQKLRLQDDIFERIAADLGWKFEPVESILARVRSAP